MGVRVGVSVGVARVRQMPRVSIVRLACASCMVPGSTSPARPPVHGTGSTSVDQVLEVAYMLDVVVDDVHNPPVVDLGTGGGWMYGRG